MVFADSRYTFLSSIIDMHRPEVKCIKYQPILSYEDTFGTPTKRSDATTYELHCCLKVYIHMHQ